MYIRNNGVEIFIVSVCIDELVVTGTSAEGIKEFKQQMMKEFKMTNLRLLAYNLSIELHQKKDCIMLKQSIYAKKVLQQFKMTKYNKTKYLTEAKLQLERMVKEAW